MTGGTKQYEIVFMLKAALDSSMNQFSAMGGQIRALEEKVQQYQNTMRDIEAFQRQQQELQKLEQEYARTQTQLDGATAAFTQATAEVKAAEQAVAQHTAEIERLNQRTKEEQTRITEISAAMEKESANIQALNAQKAEHQAQIARINEALAKEKAGIAEITAAMRQESAESKALKAERADHQAQIVKLNESLAQEKARIAEISAAMKQEGADRKALKGEQAAHQAQIAKLNESLAQEKARIAEINAALKQESEGRKALKGEQAAHQAQIAKLNESLAQEKARIAEINAAIQKEAEGTKSLKAEQAAHQAEIAKINEALSREKAELKNSTEALNQKKAAEKAALEQKNALQNSSDRLREKIGQEKAAIQTAAEALRKMGVDTKDLDAAMEKLGRDMQTAKGELDKLANMRNSINVLADQFLAAKMAADAILPTLNQVNDFFGNSIRLAADLEFQMSSVEAISGASAGEMEKLTAAAKQMGATTRYTALDAAAALQTMALAGWEAEGMASALPGVVNLAAAANENLAQMTMIVVDGMNAFGMAGTENAKKFSDVLAKAATSSSTTVAQLGDALKAVQGTAGNLGYTIEDVSTVLAAMANNGLKAAVSGTALNTLLTRLSGGIKAAEDLMNSMGVSMYYTSDAFGHTAGEAKPLLEFMNDLREGFKQFGDDAQEAQVAAYKLAGMRGMKGLLSITNLSDEAWQKLCKDVSEYSGAAERIAGISMENYQGQLYLLTSAWDALKTSVGEKFLPTATEALKVLTDITTGANEFVKEHGYITRFIAGTTASLGGLLTTLGAISIAVQSFRFIINTLPLGSLLGVGGAFGFIAAAAATAGIAYAKFAEEAEKASTKAERASQETRQTYEENIGAIEAEQDSVMGLVSQMEELAQKDRRTAAEQAQLAAVTKQLNDAIPDLNLAYDEQSDTLEGLTGNLDEYVEKLYQAKKRQEDVAHMVELKQNIHETEEALRGAREELERAEAAAANETGFTKYSQAQSDLQKTQGEVARLTFVLNEQTGELEKLEVAYNDVSDAQGKAADATDDFIDAFDAAQTSVNNLTQAFREQFDEERENIEKLFGLFDKVEEKTKQLADMQEALDSQQKFLEDYHKNLETLKTWAEQTGTNISGVWGELTDYSQDAAAAVGAIAQEIEKGDPDGAARKYLEAVDALNAEKDEIAAFVAYESDSVQAALEQAGNAIEAKINDTEAKEAALRAMSETFDGYIEGVDNGIGRLSNAMDRMASVLRAKIAALPVIPSVKVSGTGAAAYTPGNGGRMPIGYASGTASAASGVALVGEEGPELMILRGGEKIMNAKETRELRQEAVLLQKAMPDYYKAAAGFQDGEGRIQQEVLLWNAETLRRLEQAKGENAALSSLSRIPGYASGTASAAPGVAMVGEQGPELMVMQGGERIFPAEETAQILRAAQRQTADGIIREADRESILKTVETHRLIQDVQEKTVRLENQATRFIRTVQETGGDRTTVQETIRVLRAFQDTEKTIREVTASREAETTTLRGLEQQTRSLRMEDEVSRIIRIVRESGNSRTETEAILRVLRTNERSSAILWEVEAVKNFDSELRIVREAEERIRSVLSDSRTSGMIQTMETILRREEGDSFTASAQSPGPLEVVQSAVPSTRGDYDGGGGEINLNVTYNIDGGGDTERLREVLRSNEKELSKLIRRVIREERENQRRRAFV